MSLILAQFQEYEKDVPHSVYLAYDVRVCTRTHTKETIRIPASRTMENNQSRSNARAYDAYRN